MEPPATPRPTVAATGTPIDAVRPTRPVSPREATAVSLPLEIAGPEPTPDPASELCTSAVTGASMTYAEALSLAQASSCAEQGDLRPAHFCNDFTGTWWLSLGTDVDNCNPACVVDVNSGEAAINWRCTGIADPTVAAPQLQPTEISAQPTAETERFFGWQGVIFRQPAGSQVEYRFVRDDGQWYDLTARDSAMRLQFADAAWLAAEVTITGEYGDAPGLILVDALVQGESSQSDPRNLTAFAMPSISSQAPTDIGGAYGAWSAVDGNTALPWCEGAIGPGGGEWLKLDFTAPIEVTELQLVNGFSAEGPLFELNNRVLTMTIMMDGEEIGEWNLADVPGVQTYTLAGDIVPGVVASSIRFIIGDTVPGWEYDDTCLAEVAVWGRPAQ